MAVELAAISFEIFVDRVGDGSVEMSGVTFSNEYREQPFVCITALGYSDEYTSRLAVYTPALTFPILANQLIIKLIMTDLLPSITSVNFTNIVISSPEEVGTVSGTYSGGEITVNQYFGLTRPDLIEAQMDLGGTVMGHAVNKTLTFKSDFSKYPLELDEDLQIMTLKLVQQ